MSLLQKRLSIRQYKETKVSKEDIEILLRAAMQAPSAHNQQPWEFIVVDDIELIKALSKITPSFRPLSTAPLAIVVLKRYSDKSPQYISQDLSAATQNILLEATNLGLGSVWMGVYPREDRVDGVANLLNIKKDLTPFSMIALGEVNEEKEVSSRFDSSRIHYNKMG